MNGIQQKEYISNLLGGIVSVPLDKDLPYDELERSLIRSKADVIVFDEKLKGNISKIKESNKTILLSSFIIFNGTPGKPAPVPISITEYSFEFSLGEFYLEKLKGFELVFRSPSCLPTV